MTHALTKQGICEVVLWLQGYDRQRSPTDQLDLRLDDVALEAPLDEQVEQLSKAMNRAPLEPHVEQLCVGVEPHGLEAVATSPEDIVVGVGVLERVMALFVVRRKRADVDLSVVDLHEHEIRLQRLHVTSPQPRGECSR
jgi:hypothetical protein